MIRCFTLLVSFDVLRSTNGHVCDIPESTSLLQHQTISKAARASTEVSRYSNSQTSDECSEEAVEVIPQPQNIDLGNCNPLNLTRDVKLKIESPSDMLRKAVELYFLKKVAFAISAEASVVHLRLRLSTNIPSTLGEEGYTLHICSTGIDITALTEHGLFNGIMTLSQLPRRCAGAWTLPAVHVSDIPAMSWRGLMLDVSRHFFTPENITRLLDTMAMFKFNRLHWHITDDQGWRIDIPELPELTQRGAWREGTQIGHSSQVDHQRYGGYYTEEDVQRVVQHAHNLFIEVVPEIDMPGHVQAAIASYPELGNDNIPGWKPPEVAQTWGAKQYTLAPNMESLEFAKTVLTKVSNLTASRFIHIGGDEVSTSQWDQSSLPASAEALLHGQRPRDFWTEQLATHVLNQKRTPIVWDEALNSDALPQDAIIMVWRPGPDPGEIAKKALNHGRQVILAPQSYTYFDRPQANGEIGPSHDSAGGDILSLRKVYEFPVEDFGWSRNASVLGGQGQLWTEYMQTFSDVEYMAWPRGIALAEVLWSADHRPGFTDFRRRLEHVLNEWNQDPRSPNFRRLSALDLEDSPSVFMYQLWKSVTEVLRAWDPLGLI